VRRLAYEASDTCPELAAGIRRVKGARRYPDGIVRQLWLYNLPTSIAIHAIISPSRSEGSVRVGSEF